MNDLERERNFYRDQYNDLGKRVLRLIEEQTRASRKVKRSRTTATLIREVYHLLTDSAVSMDEIGERFLRVILDTLSVDRAALFKYMAGEECFVLQHSLNFPQTTQIDFNPPHLPKEFYFVNSSSSPCDPILESLRRVAGIPYLLWFFDPLAGIALLVGNATEDQHLHRPFEEDDREIAKDALNLFIEIVKRKQIENALAESEKKFRAISTSAKDAIIMLDNEGNISYWNEAAERIFGYLSEEVLGKECHLFLMPGHYHKAYKKGFLKFKTTGKGHVIGKTLEVAAIKKDKTEFPIELSVSAVKIDDKWNAVGIVRDITERKRLEEELTKAQKLESIGLLAGGIAHDFNNILASIVINIQIAKMQLESGANIVKYLDGLEKATHRATVLTQQLLTFAKGGAPIREITSISESLKDTAIFALSGSNVRGGFSIADDLWLVKVDTGQISQVFNNLVINAKEAMPEGGTVKIKAENLTVKDDQYPLIPKGNYIKLSIEDQGIGIQKEHLSKILDPFFTTKHKGSGLGLAIVHSIIKKHGGYIDVQSELGTGTCVTIFLPAQEKKITVEEKKTDRITKGEGKILLVDDNEDILETIGEGSNALVIR